MCAAGNWQGFSRGCVRWFGAQVGGGSALVLQAPLQKWEVTRSKEFNLEFEIFPLKLLFALCGHPAGWEKGFKIHQELCIKETPLFSVGERGFRVQRTDWRCAWSTTCCMGNFLLLETSGMCGWCLWTRHYSGCELAWLWKDLRWTFDYAKLKM